VKRYDLIEYPACGTYDKMMDERPDGDWCSFEEVQALLRAVAGDVRTLNHQHNCSAQLCAKCGWRNGGPRHDDTLASSHGFEYHEFEVGACNCPRGKVLAMLEVE
jgi:hypothetical protein